MGEILNINELSEETGILKEKLNDPWWRVTSGELYKIMIKGDEEQFDEEGELMVDLILKFCPNYAQMDFLQKLHFRNVIVKARQLGFTTLIAIYYLDCVLFGRKNTRAGMIAQTDEVAKALFRDKVLFAYENLPIALQQAMPLATKNTKELLFEHNNSSIKVATSVRSGTIQYLHVSEFGKICADFPDRAEEIITGSIPAVPKNGMLIIESTSEGQDGHFFKIADRAKKIFDMGKNLNQKDYKLHFYAWWKEPNYRMDPDGVEIGTAEHKYFDEVEALIGQELDIQQRSWWVATRDAEFSGEDSKMWQEYPSTYEEAFRKSTEGHFYTKQMALARVQGRITSVPWRAGYPVNTFWDIGHGDGTAVWFHQRVGQFDNFIKFIEGWEEPYDYFVGEMQKTGWVWGTHYLPHDAKQVRQGQTEKESVSPAVMLGRLGLRNIDIVPVVDKLIHGIQSTRNAFAGAWFDKVECAEGIIHLDNYKKKFNNTTQRFTDQHVHDIHAEGADSFRQFGQGYKGDGLKKKKPKPKHKPRRMRDRSVGY